MLLRGQDGARTRERYERELPTPWGLTPKGSDPSSSGYAAADFGRRPRRATTWPGILPAQASQRSACLEPRRASVKLMRITAPLTSSTSFPQLSQTSLVTRATEFLLE